MARVIPEEVQRRLAFTGFTGNITEFIANNLCYSLVQSPQRNLSGTNLRAEVAVNASTGHVNRAGEMKHRILRRQVPCANQGVLFQGAYVAETDGTDVSASVALDASVEFGLPIGEALCKTLADNISHRSIFHGLGLLTCHEFFRKGFPAFVCAREFGRACNAHSDDSIGKLHLVPTDKLVQGAFVAAPQQDTHLLLGIAAHYGHEYPGERIPSLARSVQIADAEAVCDFLGSCEYIGKDVAVLVLETHERVYLSFFHKGLYMCSDFFDHLNSQPAGLTEAP